MRFKKAGTLSIFSICGTLALSWLLLTGRYWEESGGGGGARAAAAVPGCAAAAASRVTAASRHWRRAVWRRRGRRQLSKASLVDI